MALDLIVVGCGPAGYKAAVGAARLGASVAVVEAGRPGGNCLNEGCIPTRALLYPASLIEDCNALTGRGLVGAVRGDFAAAVRHKDAVVASLRNGLPGAMQRLGIHVVRGAARFEAPGRVRVEGDVFEAPRVVVATGSRPRALAEVPFDGRVVVSSHEFYSTLAELPEKVLCVGGGAIGVEAAYLARQYGAHVTIVERGPRLLAAYPRVPEHVADLLEARLGRLGVDVRTETRVAACRVEGGRARVTFDDGDEEDFGLVLAGIGRAPNSTGFGLEEIGARLTPSGHLRTDAFLQTSVPGVYAAGDVREGPMTANAALYDGKLVVENALGGERTRANYFKVPFVVNSALEIATVGLTEAQAEGAGFSPRSAHASFGASGKARARHDYDGFIEVVHDLETGQLLGGCIVGPEAGEQILLLGAACRSERGLWFLKDLSYSHPSWCEELERAIDPYAASLARDAENLFRPGIHAGE
ncbi:MAG TPA: NAD(P)/FAD-dependent oxidoreductase [Burkholderiales bacterium]|nr:NAD(P)/FAD-dependent oxidoreductase [Burkholderiales bacterium]